MDFRSETVQGISELRAGDKWEKDLETLFSRLGEREYHTRTKHVASRGGPCTWQWSCTPSSTSPTRTPTRGTRDPLVTRAPGTRAPPGTRARGGGWTERRPASARGGSARTPRPSLPRGTTRAGARGARRIPPAPLGPLGARGRGRRAAADPVGAGAPGGMPGPAGPVGTSAPGRARPRARGVPRPPRRVVRPRISAVGVAAPALGRVARRGSAETVRDFGGCPSPRGRCAGTPQTRSRDPGCGEIFKRCLVGWAQWTSPKRGIQPQRVECISLPPPPRGVCTGGPIQARAADPRGDPLAPRLRERDTMVPPYPTGVPPLPGTVFGQAADPPT